MQRFYNLGKNRKVIFSLVSLHCFSLHHCWEFSRQLLLPPLLLFCDANIDLLVRLSCLGAELTHFSADWKIILETRKHQEDWNRHVALKRAICCARSGDVRRGWAQQCTAHYAQPEDCTQLQWVAQQWICVMSVEVKLLVNIVHYCSG